MRAHFKFLNQPKFEKPSLIVGWKDDIGKISSKTIDFLNEKLNTQKYCEIGPEGFFSLGGITVEDNVAQFPDSSLFYGQRNDLVIFLSDQPNFEHYKFLNSVLDIAVNYCKIKELYTINGMVSSSSHTTPRRLFSVFNNQDFRDEHQGYMLEDLTWEGPPAVSSYLLWSAQKIGIPGMSLWLEVPFYLAANEDMQAIKFALSFLDQRFHLNLDFEKIELDIKEQNEKIDSLRDNDERINKYISLIESGIHLNEEDQLKLAKEIYELLKK
jgi:proteasome assembly chaperone (PAC2) family protein